MKALAALAIVATLCACSMRGGDTSFDNIERVRLGMSEAELIQIMGKPDITRITEGKQIWVWRNPLALTGASVVSFGLRDGKVIEIPNVAVMR